jgi:AcrR family transcriptional regulator
MKEDLRVTKTKKLLYETLISLMEEKSFEEIKVSDICKKALINRSTFYSHYSDKYELFMELINALKLSLFNSLNTNENNVNTREYFIELINILLNHIDDKKNIYYSILINNRNSIITDIILDVVSKDINSRITNDKISTNNIPTEIVSKFYLGAVMSIGIEYLESKNKYSKEDMIKYIDKLIPSNINL